MTETYQKQALELQHTRAELDQLKRQLADDISSVTQERSDWTVKRAELEQWYVSSSLSSHLLISSYLFSSLLILSCVPFVYLFRQGGPTARTAS